MKPIIFIPMLFGTPMVQALLADSKNKTRRINKDLRHPGFKIVSYDFDRRTYMIIEYAPDGVQICQAEMPLKYCPGDILWVRETWSKMTDLFGEFPQITYKADIPSYKQSEIKWRPKIHMPKKAARIFLQVTNVSVEKLHDISEQDCYAEGIKSFSKDKHLFKYAPADDEGDYPIWPWSECPRTPIDAYHKLWDSINAKKSGYGWVSNPWVYVVEFKRIKKPEGFLNNMRIKKPVRAET